VLDKHLTGGILDAIMRNRNITAIILSAGYAIRMGRLKPLLPLGGSTVIEQTIKRFQDAGIPEIITVLGHRFDEIVPVLKRNAVDWVVNSRYREGMLTSIQKGVGCLGSSTRAFFIMPVDIPLVRHSTVTDLMEMQAAYPSHVVYPVFDGKRGHPPLIPMQHATGILAWAGAGGLRKYLQTRSRASMDLQTADEGVLMDMDTPQDYAKILARSTHLDLPSPAEALALLNMRQPENLLLVAHSTTVARVAVQIGESLTRSGGKMDLVLLETAGLLHDIAKGEADHAERGADWVAKKGFKTVAEVIRTHMNIEMDHETGIHEKEIVYLADKMVSGDMIVPLEKRLSQKIEQFAGDLKAIEMVTIRMENAIRIRRSIEEIIGNELDIIR